MYVGCLNFLPKHLADRPASQPVSRPVYLCTLVCFKSQRPLPPSRLRWTHLRCCCQVGINVLHVVRRRARKQNYTLFILFIFHFCAVSSSSSYAVAPNAFQAVLLLPSQWLCRAAALLNTRARTHTRTHVHFHICMQLIVFLLVLFVVAVVYIKFVSACAESGNFILDFSFFIFHFCCCCCCLPPLRVQSQSWRSIVVLCHSTCPSLPP